MTAVGDGHFELNMGPVAAGDLYSYRLNDGPARPDPRSLSQPLGVHRPSAVVWPQDFQWSDQDWRGIPQSQLIIYEMHVGTFTPEGNLDGAINRLPDLVDLGVTAVEVMPLAPYPGRRGWGYDGVALFGVHESYGGPQAFQRFVDACHRHGLAVILDMVYNHLGPEGNYLSEFGPYFTERHHTPWGAAVNYDGPDAGPVRRFVTDNVRHWIHDFHVDGLRLDAIQTIIDDSDETIIAEVARVAREESLLVGRPLHVIGETDENDARLITDRDQGGSGLSAIWSDDFHHAVHAYLTGDRFSYYNKFGDPRQIALALQKNFVFDKTPVMAGAADQENPGSRLPTDRFVLCIQNHDQVGNRAKGDRLSTMVTPAANRLAVGLLLLAPGIPLLYMGEEYAERNPFPFFSDFQDPGLGRAVVAGRKREFVSVGCKGDFPNPQDAATYQSAILSWNWSDPVQASMRRLYQSLLRARRRSPALQQTTLPQVDFAENAAGGAVLTLLRQSPDQTDRVIAFFNLTDRIQSFTLPETAQRVSLAFSSQEDRFTGLQNGEVVPGQLHPHEFQVFATTTEHFRS